ncbi:hypothetical protein HELRODRAFT_176767 [Helobdella robusta]|uniref:Uncharacterized protein n=1 Tax=Helobdella robusta TaxID=6412 RepID=T1FAW1_HELRO|nr:hypothetical protein HELRODRAFT_176767 [Helobdella robusta]ESN99602.1 hypothetical protein HELRODRAFT_176767 [Helobdella robusta]
MPRKKRPVDIDPGDVSSPISRKILKLHIEGASSENACNPVNCIEAHFSGDSNPSIMASPEPHPSYAPANLYPHPYINAANMSNNAMNDHIIPAAAAPAVATPSSSSSVPQPAANYFTGQHYQPELSEEENPCYYNINKHLFYLHMERMARSKGSHQLQQ